MTKLVTPVAILITIALLALYGAYAAWQTIQYFAWSSLVTGLLAIVACIALARLASWSQYPVYILTIVFTADWLYSIRAAAKVGYFELFGTRQIALQLLPGAALVALFWICAALVFRYFRHQRRGP